MNELGSERLFMISAFILAAVFIIRLPVMLRPKNFRYEYEARTDFKKDDHTYVFQIRMLRDGSYRCYIVKAPYLMGRKFSRYATSFEEERGTDNKYIFCNHNIFRADEAKKQCADWSDINQHIVDSCRYRP